jgi:putative lipoic acid-binding regulatory protein
MSKTPQLSFPIFITLRVIGRNREDLVEIVLELARRHVPEVDADGVSLRPSRDGNYISVLAPMRLDSKAQLDAVIAELSAHESIMMVL